MVSALDSGSSGPGSSPRRGPCVVFSDNAPVSIHVYKWVLANSMRGGNLAMDQHPMRGWGGGVGS